VTGLDDLQPRQVSYAVPLSKPVVTWVLLGIILLVFLLETLAGGSTQGDVLVRLGANAAPLVDAGEYWRFLTSMFLHIGLFHLLFNGYALLVLGTELERLVGRSRFLTIYLLSGLVGSLASFALNPGLSAGASGAIFGLIGALAAFFYLHRQALGAWGRRRLSNIAFLIVLNLFLGFTRPGIDNLAHLGGLLAGFALGWALAPRYQVDPLEQHLVDRNRLARYWPAVALVILILVVGTVVATFLYQANPAARVLVP
jgi:rhomboid protease GluP